MRDMTMIMSIFPDLNMIVFKKKAKKKPFEFLFL